MSLGIGSSTDTVTLLLSQLPKEERVCGTISKALYAPEASNGNNELFDTPQKVARWKTRYQWLLTIESDSKGNIADALLSTIINPEDTPDRSDSPVYSMRFKRKKRIRHDRGSRYAIYHINDQGKITQAILTGIRGQPQSVVQGGLFFREKDKEKVCAVIKKYGIVRPLAEVIGEGATTLNVNVISVVIKYLEEFCLWELRGKKD